jgi:hypothetical protein
MAKFATYLDVAKGVQARKIVTIRLIGMPPAADPIPIALVPLDFGTDSDALEYARDFAKKRKVEDPKPGDPLYERGLMLHTVLLAAVDVDSPEDKPEPFFANEAEITKHLDPDRVAVLFHQQRAWQAMISPLPRTMDPGTYIATLAAQMRAPEVADLPFDALPLAMRRSFLAQSALLLSELPQLKLLLGSFSLGDEKTSTSTSSTGPSPSETPPAPPPPRAPSSKARSKTAKAVKRPKRRAK